LLSKRTNTGAFGKQRTLQKHMRVPQNKKTRALGHAFDRSMTKESTGLEIKPPVLFPAKSTLKL
jgi:hypothetical protein